MAKSELERSRFEVFSVTTAKDKAFTREQAGGNILCSIKVSKSLAQLPLVTVGDTEELVDPVEVQVLRRFGVLEL